MTMIVTTKQSNSTDPTQKDKIDMRDNNLRGLLFVDGVYIAKKRLKGSRAEKITKFTQDELVKYFRSKVNRVIIDERTSVYVTDEKFENKETLIANYSDLNKFNDEIRINRSSEVSEQ